MRYSLLAVLVGLVGLAAVVPPIVGLKICVPHGVETECEELVRTARTTQCVYGRDITDCLKIVSYDRGADLVAVEAQDVYNGGNFYSMVPVAYILENNKPYKYRGAAVIPKNSTIQNLADLYGRKSCHTGVGRNAGWNIPLGVLASKTQLKVDCRSDLHSMASIFNTKSCAPGDWSSDPTVDNELKKEHYTLCKGCAGDCSKKSSFAGYEGALKCLTATKADVAFTTVEAAVAYFKDNSTAGKEEYRFLCKDGKTTNITDAKSCHWAARPTTAFLGAKNIDSTRIANYVAELQGLLKNYSSTEWLQKIIPAFKNATAVLPTNSSNNNWTTYLGDYISTFEYSFKDCRASTKTICAPSSIAYEKCVDLTKAAASRQLRPLLTCIQASGNKGCIDKMDNNQAFIITLDAGDLYYAGKDKGLMPVIKEKHRGTNGSYYAVAVIKANSTIKNISDLKGTKSCHTGMNRTAGWNVPVGVLIDKKLLSKNCDHALEVSKFFNNSCVPGANDKVYNPKLSGKDKLCKLCIGDSRAHNKCARTSVEQYNGYEGAFRCLAEKGNVAFVKHTTVREYSDGKSQLPWARNLKASQFKLLCQEGGTASVDEYEKCNLALVPSHFVVLPRNTKKEDILIISRLMIKIGDLFGHNASSFKLFGSYKNNADVLFKDSAKGFLIASLEGDMKEALGKKYLSILKKMDNKTCKSAARNIEPCYWAVFLTSIVLFFKMN